LDEISQEAGGEDLQHEKLIRRIEIANAFVLFTFVAGACVFFSLEMARGVLLGGIISIVGYYTLKWQLRRALLNPERVPARGRVLVGYYLRFFGLIFVIFTIVYCKWAQPIAFLVGLSVVVTSLLLVGVGEFLVMLQKGE
jgi:hypothetical protein